MGQGAAAEWSGELSQRVTGKQHRAAEGAAAARRSGDKEADAAMGCLCAREDHAEGLFATVTPSVTKSDNAKPSGEKPSVKTKEGHDTAEHD